MAGYKGKSKTISSVSDILGFVLEQSELPPERRRPIRPPERGETQSESDYADSLVEALAMPGVFVGDQYLKTIQGLVDPSVSIKTQTGRLPFVKMKTSDLPAFFDNPDEFIDKMFGRSREASKMERLQWAGEQMRMLAGSTYAKKMGLFEGYDSEMKAVLERALGQSAMDSASMRDRQWIALASEDLRTKGLISKLDPKKHPELRGIQRLNEIDEQLSKSSVRNSLSKEQLVVLNRERDGLAEKVGDMGSFRSLLRLEFNQKAKSILGKRERAELSSDELKELNKVESANNTIDLWSNYGTLDKYGMKEKRGNLREVNEKIRIGKENFKDQIDSIKNGKVFEFENGQKVDYSTLSESDRSKAIVEARKNIKQLDTTRRSLSSVRFWGGIGKLEGTYYGLQATLGPGSLEAFLNGDFFDPNKGYFGCPAGEGKKNFSKDVKDQGWNVSKFVRSKSAEVKGKKTLSDNYNNAMVGLYYLNPAVWMKSLVTGEGFAWIADNVKNRMATIRGVSTGVFADMNKPEFVSFYRKLSNLTGPEREQFLGENGKYSHLVKLLSYKSKDPSSNVTKDLSKLMRLSKSMEGFEKLAKFFSTPSRIKNYLTEKSLGKLQKAVRNGVFKVLSKMKIFTADKVAMGFLKAWKVTGGAALSSAIATGIVSALGLAASAIGTPLAGAITILVSIALEKIAKVTIKLLIFALVGVVGLIVLVFTPMNTQNLQAQVDSYSRETPGSIQYNEKFKDYGNSEDMDGESDLDIPPLSDQECILSEDDAPCTQGFVDIPAGYTHHTLMPSKPVDLAFLGNIYAPQFCSKSKQNCLVTRAWDNYTEEYREKYCGGANTNPGGELYLEGTYTDDSGRSNTFQLQFYHVIPYVPHVEDSSSAIAVGPGEPLAKIGTAADGLSANLCWSGPHLHLSTKLDSAFVNPLELLNSWGCYLPSEDECQI